MISVLEQKKILQGKRKPLVKIPRLTRLQWTAHAGAISPIIWLIYSYATGNLTFNPIQAATQRTGDFALILLILSLACTPIHILTGYKGVLKLRKMLGLYAFAYAATHLFIFSVIDYQLDFQQIGPLIVEKKYILVGLASIIILSLLAATSFRWWMKRLGKNWKRLHRLVYVAGLLVILHYGWASKGDFFNLQGNIWKPLLAGAIVIALLATRIPALRHAIIKTRSSFISTQRLRQQIRLSKTNIDEA